MKTFYLTTPLYYPNARPHVGSAYTTIVCDVLTRYKRMCGYDVAFLTGTDEHGEKLERAAADAGVSPRQFVTEKRKLFIELWKKLDIEYKHFVYTDQPDHVTSVQRMLRLAQQNEPGVIEKRRYEGRYCVFDEMYVSEGSEPVACLNCGRPTELISEENYFFRLSAFEKRLLDHYKKHPEFVQPDFRRNEVISFVKGGLRDISVSRKRIKWGIPWPDDPEQVFYVWYDALTGYLTGIGYAQGEQGGPDFQKYWRNDASGEIVHMIGKDILRFHAVYWPAFLMAARLPLPKTVFAHGWIYYEQDKMSKSKGNVVYPEPIVDALDSFGAPGNDALRYYLLREAPFGQDTSFSYDALIQRYNSDLANDLGNLAYRTLSLLYQQCEGKVPDPRGADHGDNPLRSTAEEALAEFRRHFEAYDFSRALDAVWVLISRANKYLNEQKPWAKLLANDIQPEQALYRATTLYAAAETVRFISVLLYAVIPKSAEQLWKQLGCEEYVGNIADQQLDNLKWRGLKPGTKLGKLEPPLRLDKSAAQAEPIFPRLDKGAALERLLKLQAAEQGAPAKEEPSKMEPKPVAPGFSPAEPKSPEVLQAPNPESRTPTTGEHAASPESAGTDQKITIDDFAKIDMRVGEVLSAEPIPGAKRLLKLMVDIGAEVRQVCAGIAEYYQPEQLVGMKVILVANLQPRKLRGVESNGMIVAASVGEEGRPVLATFKEDVPKGAKLK
jgi:methionyl-tRNA synthetase